MSRKGNRASDLTHKLDSPTIGDVSAFGAVMVFAVSFAGAVTLRKSAANCRNREGSMLKNPRLK